MIPVDLPSAGIASRVQGSKGPGLADDRRKNLEWRVPLPQCLINDKNVHWLAGSSKFFKLR